MLIWYVAAPAPLVASSYWTFVALNLRYDTAGAMKLVGGRLPGRSAIAEEPRQAKEETQEPTKGTEHPEKRGQRNGGGALAEERRQRREAGRKGRDRRKRAAGGGRGRREA